MDVTNFNTIRDYIATRIIGQQHLVDAMLIGLLCEGHLLIEGMPGLAKTTAVKALADTIEGDFQRVQFTPDLLPSDLIGTDVYRREQGEFEFRHGPIFHNLVLADEINRAPAKVQSALLEAMGEGTVTVGSTTYKLPELFMVLATQNPVEQEGTYPLPEAQLDRFLMHVWVDYPTAAEELQIMDLDSSKYQQQTLAKPKPMPQKAILKARKEVANVFIDPKLNEYIVSLIISTRDPSAYDADLGRWSRFGASPRASLALARCAKALAWLSGDEYVTPAHIQAIAPDVLRHRILLTFEAEADAVTTDDFVRKLLEVVAIP
ncbi:MAG: MoxR family ATPase [Methylococcales bacterium]|jgi:MoxR-like ATPase|nr:MoxR family ATPase [Methylococcales bacterium]MBT7445506.1 MoxR family ATPase [Methylococcales bacterium]